MFNFRSIVLLTQKTDVVDFLIKYQQITINMLVFYFCFRHNNNNNRAKKEKTLLTFLLYINKITISWQHGK